MAEELNDELEKAPDAVLILKKQGDNGRIDTDVVPLGDVRLTEVQTLIELGAAKWRRKIGLE